MQETKGIYKRGEVYWYRYQVAGHRRQESLHTGDLGEAIAYARVLRTDPAGKTGDTVEPT